MLASAYRISLRQASPSVCLRLPLGFYLNHFTLQLLLLSLCHDRHLYHTHMPRFYSIFHIIIFRAPPKNDATVSTNPSHFSGHFYRFISPSEPRRTSTGHISGSARQVPHSRVEPRFLSLDPRKMSPVAFLLSIHEGPSTRMERNMPRRLPQFIWSFYDLS